MRRGGTGVRGLTASFPASRRNILRENTIMAHLRIRLALLTAMLAVATLVTFSVCPARALEKIKIHRMGGEIAGDDASDGADLETMGGDIRVTRSHNLVHAHTMGGNIEIGSADGSVNVQTMGGNIQIASASGSVTAETMGGNVTTHIHNPIAPGMHDINLSSMGGNIELTIPKDFPKIGRASCRERV